MKALIICAAPETDLSYVTEQSENADKILCADGGLKYALSLGINPDIVIGDFDSFEGDLPDVPAERLSPCKDDTDTLCCINKAIELGCDEIALVCAIGGRLDHTLANISSLLYMSERGAAGEIISSREKILLMIEGNYCFKNQRDRTFSVFALGDEGCVISYKNAEYPLSRHRLSASYPIGISNIFTQDSAEITVHSGKAVLIINEVL